MENDGKWVRHMGKRNKHLTIYLYIETCFSEWPLFRFPLSLLIQFHQKMKQGAGRLVQALGSCWLRLNHRCLRLITSGATLNTELSRCVWTEDNRAFGMFFFFIVPSKHFLQRKKNGPWLNPFLHSLSSGHNPCDFTGIQRLSILIAWQQACLKGHLCLQSCEYEYIQEIM